MSKRKLQSASIRIRLINNNTILISHLVSKVIALQTATKLFWHSKNYSIAYTLPHTFFCLLLFLVIFAGTFALSKNIHIYFNTNLIMQVFFFK